MKQIKMNKAIRGVRWLLTVLTVLVVSCTTTDLVTGRETQNLFALTDDIDMGREGIKEFRDELAKEGIPIDADTETKRHLQGLIGDLVKANNLTNFPFDVTVFETNVVNAMALPGGQLLAFPGLWGEEEGLVRDDDELAAVFGHEIAHVTCRHSTEELTKLLPVELIMGGVAIYAELEEDEDLQWAVAGAFLLYQGLLIPKYSRADECESDHVGMMYMARAGYDPRAAIRLWKRAHEQEGSEPAILSIFSTHPTHENRYKDLEKHLPEALVLYEASKKRSGNFVQNYWKRKPSTGGTTAVADAVKEEVSDEAPSFRTKIKDSE